jgi:hypothetical protein
MMDRYQLEELAAVATPVAIDELLQARTRCARRRAA